MEKVLFVCIHNSARSQMAEAYLKKYAADIFEVESAGIEPGILNPFVVQTMREDGIDISENKTQSVGSLLKQHKNYDAVITVCDEASSQRCPVFPGKGQKEHWPFPDPSSFEGSDAQKLEFTKKVRDAIKKRVIEFVKSQKG